MGSPSGKLPDTFAARLEDYPSSYNFHESDFYVDYTDDIYVGYRYFETIPGALAKVNYPFGFGLSYTQFDWQVVSVSENWVSFLYRWILPMWENDRAKRFCRYMAWHRREKLGKSKRHLLVFEKSRLLQPGETQRLRLAWKMEDMASYDDLGKVKKSAYVLEQGDYFSTLAIPWKMLKNWIIHILRLRIRWFYSASLNWCRRLSKKECWRMEPWSHCHSCRPAIRKNADCRIFQRNR